MKLIAVVLFAAYAFAQEADGLRLLTVRAHGTASVSETPDQVRVNVGVVTQAQTAQAAGAANAKQSTEVIAELKRVAGSAADIRTVSYSVNPNYRFPQSGGTPTITGYTATNVVQVTSPEIAIAGKIIDAATRNGANTIQGIQFSLKDEQPVRAQALRDAAQQARANAHAMAAAVGMKFVRIVKLEDSAPVEVHPVREMMQMRSAMADSPPTPVEPGTIRVQASVVLTAEIAQ